MKIPFDQLFERCANGHYTPKRPIRIGIGGSGFEPGFRIDPKLKHGGITISELVGKTLEVDETKRVAVILYP